VLDYPEKREREAQYSPSSMIHDINVHLDRYAVESAEARTVLEHETIAYGDGPEESMDAFWAPDGDLVHIFIHGGYWQELSKADSSFPAPGFLSRGVSYVALGYPLAPEATLQEIIDACARGVAYVIDRGQKVILSGSSAGAHLAAMVARQFADDGQIHRPIVGLVLLSGIYDLRPLIDTYINDPLGLDNTSARSLSPLFRPALALPTIIAVGEIETPAFKAQSQALVTHWGLGNVLEVPERNHFDIVFDLSSRSTILGNRVAEMETV
jgi:arylformamidase